MSSDARPEQAREPWRVVAVGTAVVLALLAFYQVVAADGMVFAGAALLYAAGALFIGQGRTLGYWLVAVPSLAVAVTQAWALVGSGVRPDAYAGTPAFLMVVLGLPLAAVNLLAALRELLREGR